MPRQTEHSEHPDTLPTAEVNPLLNPVLGQNMGRWAEVYFTSPPEKREQAVLELLRELEAVGSATGDNAAAAPSWIPEPSLNPVLAADAQVPQQSTLVACYNCGREMPASQKYCGMCGAHLSETMTAESQGGKNPVEERQTQEMSPYGSNPLESTEPEYVSEPEIYEPRSTSNPLSLFQTGGDAHYRDDSNDEIFSYAPPSRPYRVYVGIALAIIIFTLAYMAWRSAQATSQSSHIAPQAPPAVATQPPAQVPQATPQQEVPERTASAEERPATPSANAAHSAAPEASAKSTNVKRGRNEASNKPSPPPAPIPEKQAEEEATAGNGTQELAVAQRYLYGTNGERQNRAEAAKWLWKAMAKHNANATLLLADLYLKGDGVTKNCDQARVLLDSAARAGMKEAGERLRHLQAFGCE